MKRLVIVAAVAAVAVSCGTNATTRVSGTLPEDSKTTEVRILAGELDTTVVLNNGAFEIDVPNNLISLAYASADGAQVAFVADGTRIDVDFAEGVATSNSKKGVNSRLYKYRSWNDEFMEDFRARMSAEDLSEEEKEAVYEKADEEYNAYLINLVKQNPDNVLGIIGISNVDVEDSQMLELIGLLSDELQEDTHIKNMKKALDASSKTAEGRMFTDFEVDGVKFSDFIGKGKYVLVDFWASWCGPCRREMPNLRSVYEQFHGDKFDMLSVAVWDKPEDTVVAAKEENIVWNQIINAQRIPTDIYGIQGIPHIILFGPDGTILRRGLRGDAIGQAVAAALAE